MIHKGRYEVNNRNSYFQNNQIQLKYVFGVNKISLE